MTAIAYTPAVAELLPDHKINCTQPNCSAVFTNNGNYELHLVKRHKIMPSKRAAAQLYHCPQQDCIYHAQGEKHFKNLKYLRQHFYKMHAAKTHICAGCGKGFVTPGLLSTHEERVCGRKFVCNECGWDYGSMEALMTHGKRKGHAIKTSAEEEELVGSATATMNNAKAAKRRRKSAVHTPTHTVGVQTETHNTSIAISTDTSESVKVLHMETQTELSLSAAATPPNSDSASNTELIDPIFAQSSHMHTQTCADFLSELGLADIQTQTNWSSVSSGESKHAFAATDSATSCVHDELLVSTETQTSFTQYLLNSCHDGNVESSFPGLYNTQYTQTCDTLLAGLFDSQDFIGGLQSTHTQT